MSGRALHVMLAVAVVVAAIAVADEVLRAPYVDWNDSRLAPSAALLRGLPIYVPAASGAALAHIYGPIGPFVYLVPALVADPTWAVIFGAAWTFLLYMAPVMLLFALASSGSPWWTATLSTLFVLYSFGTPALTAPAFYIHVDGPALCFAALSCVALWRWSESKDRRLWWLAALCAALSVGAKQIALPIVLAEALWVREHGGGWLAARYAAATAACGLALLALVSPLIDVRDLVFNALLVPASHPWNGGTLPGVVDAASALGRRLAPVGLVVCAMVWFERERLRRHLGGLPGLLLLVAIASAPTAVLARAKFGGAPNTLAFPLYFLLLTALTAAFSRAGTRHRVVAAGCLLVLVLATLPRVGRSPALRGELPPDPLALMQDFAERYPDQVYLPFNPLVGLAVHGELHHFSYALLDRALAGAPVDREHFLRHVPSAIRYVATTRAPRHRPYALEYFPGLRRVESSHLTLRVWATDVSAVVAPELPATLGDRAPGFP